MTGANSGIGKASAHLFADQSAKLVVTARDQQRLDLRLHLWGIQSVFRIKLLMLRVKLQYLD
ncbi:hypothetical protein RFH42_09785 [Acinetobacter rudis]|uniref:hypothetical protein n=1 Tax=Acinetobacter rudis TaxID=632955 RepID=UPI00280C9A9F|nr:hypothetical protein [Acinetobacter rudis]MDQ8953250.1 hypothetical protein [Acinetobacter rudis]